MHEFAFEFSGVLSWSAVGIARLGVSDAPALKPTHEARRRGGESTARQHTFAHLFSQPERVAVLRGFARVSVGGAGAFEGVAGF